MIRSRMLQIGALAAGILATLAAASPEPDPAHAMDPAHSTLTLHVWKTGLFSFAADNHIINAPLSSGSVNEAAKTVELTVKAADIKVLDPSTPANRRADVQARMESADVLDVQKYPKIEFKSTTLVFDASGKAEVTGDLTLHGQTHPLKVHVTRQSLGHYHGTAVIRQSAFGITPIRIVGGTVRVKDNVDVDFDIVTRSN